MSEADSILSSVPAARYGGDFGDVSGPASVFIQWKGTDVCFDFHCGCGGDGHFDGYFAYSVKCPSCGKVYSLPHSVALAPADAFNDKWHDPVEVDVDG